MATTIQFSYQLKVFAVIRDNYGELTLEVVDELSEIYEQTFEKEKESAQRAVSFILAQRRVRSYPPDACFYGSMKLPRL